MKVLGICAAAVWIVLSASPAHAFERVSLELPDCITGAFDALELKQALLRDLKAEGTEVYLWQERPPEGSALLAGHAHVLLLPPQCTADDDSVKVHVSYGAQSGRRIGVTTEVTLDDVPPEERSLILAVAVLELLRVSERTLPAATTAITATTAASVSTAGAGKTPSSIHSSSAGSPPAGEKRRASLDASFRLTRRTADAPAFLGAGLGMEYAIWARWFVRVAFGYETAEPRTAWGPVSLALFAPEAGVQAVLHSEPRLSLGPELGVAIVRARGQSVLPGVEETPRWEHSITLSGRAAAAASLLPHVRLLVAVGLGGHLRRLQLTAGSQELVSLSGMLARGEVGIAFDF